MLTVGILDSLDKPLTEFLRLAVTLYLVEKYGRAIAGIMLVIFLSLCFGLWEQCSYSLQNYLTLLCKERIGFCTSLLPRPLRLCASAFPLLGPLARPFALFAPLRWKPVRNHTRYV